MKLEVAVTRHYIIAGKRNDVYSCPIALAVADSGQLVHVEVTQKTLKGWDKLSEKWHRGRLPQEARDFIAKFDNGAGKLKKLRPLLFEMNAYPV